ncbi:MAG: magnesium/cobalt transporter CorA [Candidatus Omnitrophica bacterium]|nr:magnesium/cobalt transporter CorA [Candidatus Omnitrophota bacterium]
MVRCCAINKDGVYEEFTDENRITELLSIPEALIWADVDRPAEDDIEILLNRFGLHPLTVEDIILPNARPKAENFDKYLFVVLHAIGQESVSGGEMEPIELDICVGGNFVITAHSTALRCVDFNWERFAKGSPNMRRGTDFLFHSIADAVVDHYFPIVDHLDEQTDKLEDKLFEDPDPEDLTKLHDLRKQAMVLRRIIGPQRDLVSSLLRGDFRWIRPAVYMYLRDVHDHLVRLHDLVDASRELIAGSLDTYVSVTSNRLNEIMKVLAVIATMMMPLTLITGIYGMNFANMPELHHPWGYPLVWVLMAAVAGGMFLYFKKQNWF